MNPLSLLHNRIHTLTLFRLFAAVVVIDAVAMVGGTLIAEHLNATAGLIIIFIGISAMFLGLALSYTRKDYRP